MKKRELTEKQKAFLDALFSDEAKGNPAIAVTLAGYGDGVTAHSVMSSLTDEIIERAKKHLALNSGRAVFNLLEVMDKPSAAGAMTKLKAAVEILGRVGVKEKDQVEATPNGIVILPAKGTTISVTSSNDDNEG